MKSSALMVNYGHI